MEEINAGNHPPSMERSDSSGSSSFSQHDEQSSAPQIQAPVPIRPHLPSRKSSGTIIVPRDSSAVDSAQIKPDPDDIRAMSPRRTSEDIEALSKDAKNELKQYVSPFPRPLPHPLPPTPSQGNSLACSWLATSNMLGRHAKALQESLVTIFNRIEAVREEHDKLDNNNKFLQKYIGDLMTTSKITSSSSRTKK